MPNCQDLHFGKGYEMYYVDENGNIGIAYLSPLDAFDHDDSVLERNDISCGCITIRIRSFMEAYRTRRRSSYNQRKIALG